MCVHVCLCVSTVVLCASIKPTSVTSTSSQPQGWLCWAEDLGFLDIANEGAQQKTFVKKIPRVVVSKVGCDVK